MDLDAETFQNQLLIWWRKHQRSFPWRKTSDPYKILIAEVLLHRTKANQVVPVYLTFVEKIPDICTLAQTSKNEIKQMLYTLGLHWRAEFLHQMAVEIIYQFDGKIPSKRIELESLSGVGQYIASAVRCFALGYSEILLDTNTVRIAGRIFGIKITDSSRRSKRFKDHLQFLMNGASCREFNFALLDLGALVCKSTNPSCDICPVLYTCEYGNSLR